jgi:hypothetical protein
MNEPTPAPLQPCVPWWERVPAGVLVVAWLGWSWWFGIGGMFWGARLRNRLSDLVWIWQKVIAAGDWGTVARPDSQAFVHGVWNAAFFFFEVGLLALAAVAFWMVRGRGSRALRGIFWLAALGHGLVGLGGLAAAGRFSYLQNYNWLSTPADPPAWHAGWFEFIFRAEDLRGWLFCSVCVIEVVLGSLLLFRGRYRDRTGGHNAAIETLERREA